MGMIMIWLYIHTQDKHAQKKPYLKQKIWFLFLRFTHNALALDFFLVHLQCHSIAHPFDLVDSLVGV